jgi:DNA-binding transcriptional regulator/RsmH inhibitor MraZ
MARKRGSKPGKDNGSEGGGPHGRKPVFVGWYDAVADDDGRIRLPSGVREQFEESGVRELWLGENRGKSALVFCPPQCWPEWVEKQKRDVDGNEPQNLRKEGIWPLQRLRWYSRGRIKLNRWARMCLPIKRGDAVVLRGQGGWFELSKANELEKDEFGKHSRETR